MSVKRITDYHLLADDAFARMSTRHLLNILESSRGYRMYCSHMGIESSDPDDIAFNENQLRVRALVKDLLRGREHVAPRVSHKRKPEKKELRYGR